MADSDQGEVSGWTRGSARLNPTVVALMRRGLDDHLAGELHRGGHTLGSLKQASDDTLEGLGLTARQIADVRKGARAEIPFDGLARVLWDNRYRCCVCRQSDVAIIVHHIEPWAESHDHSDANLAVLCLEHHARAHTRGDLEQNLSARRLRESKARWEEEVRHLDARAILEASRIDGHNWWWFNHLRLFQLAAALQVDLTRLRHYRSALSRGVIDIDGALTNSGDNSSYRYEGGDGNVLGAFVEDALAALLSAAAVFNISDDMDRGFLSRVVREGDIVLVQGRHFFKQRTTKRAGPGQVVEVRRQVNNVRVSFSLDRWEATSSSAWGYWLQGVKNLATLARVVQVDRQDGYLHLHCTGLALGSALEGLALRSYIFATWASSEEEEELDDSWFDSFGEKEEQ